MHFEFWSFPRLGMCDNMCDKISPGDPGLGVSCLSAPRQPHDHKGKQPIQVKLFCMVVLVFSLQVVSDTFASPWTVACQAPLSVGFSRQEYWSGLPFPPLRDLPNPGIEPASPTLVGGSLYP